MITSSGIASVRKLRRIVKIFPATSVMQYVERLTIAVCLPGKRAYYYPAYTQTHASISNVIYNSYVLYVLMWNNNECMRKIHPNWRHIIFAYSLLFFILLLFLLRRIASTLEEIALAEYLRVFHNLTINQSGYGAVRFVAWCEKTIIPSCSNEHCDACPVHSRTIYQIANAHIHVAFDRIDKRYFNRPETEK